MDISVIDEHHEVMLFWEEHFHELPKNVLHVDFHSDMWLPGKPENYQYAKTPGFLLDSIYTTDIRALVQNNINATSFLIPSILRYGFEKIIFLKPTGLCEEKREFTIGTLNGEGLIIRNVNTRNRIFFPDVRSFEYVEIDDLSEIQLDDYILDIDLDYFCCNMNPVRYNDVFVKYPQGILDDISAFNRSRDMYAIDLKLIGVVNDGNYLISNPDFVPVYNDNIAWIRYSIERFVAGLPKKPSLVSICRSEKLGYTPRQFALQIEEYLIEMLNTVDVIPIFPGNEPLRLSQFCQLHGKLLYNYCTEVCIDLDDVGVDIITMIQRDCATTNQIISTIQNKYGPEKSIFKDIEDYIIKLRKLLIIE